METMMKHINMETGRRSHGGRFGIRAVPQLLCLLFAYGLALGNSSAEAIDFEYYKLGEWVFYGEGFATTDTEQGVTILAEVPGSKGVMLVSPNPYPENLVLRYKVRPLTPESVLVVMLSASDKGPGEGISFPTDYDGSMKYLTTDVESFFIAFHNAAHNTTPFIRDFSFELAGGHTLAIAKSNIMTTEWHDVEVARRDGMVWLKIDGETIVETKDDAQFDGGHVILRLRGTSDRIGVALIKDVEILNVPYP
jgi:hypothetical protein